MIKKAKRADTLGLGEDEIAHICELWKAGKTRREAAITLGRAISTIQVYEKKLGLRRERFRGDAVRFNQERARQYKAKNSKASSAQRDNRPVR